MSRRKLAEKKQCSLRMGAARGDTRSSRARPGISCDESRPRLPEIPAFAGMSGDREFLLMSAPAPKQMPTLGVEAGRSFVVIPESAQRLSGTQPIWIPALRCAAAGMTAYSMHVGSISPKADTKRVAS